MFYNDKLLKELMKKKGHYVYFGVSKEQSEFIEKFLKANDNCFKTVFVLFDEKDEFKINYICKNCENEYQKNLIARAYVSTKIMMNLVSNFDLYKNREQYLNIVNSFIIMDSLSDKKIIEHLNEFPTLAEINDFQNKIPDIDLNLLVQRIKNKPLQQAVNDYLSVRNENSIKVFIDSVDLVSYKTTNGQIVVPNQDFVKKDLSLFQINDREMN